MSPNSHALAIYLEFVLICGAARKRFEKCQCEDDDVRFTVKLGFLMMAIIVGYEANQPLFHGASNQIPSSHYSSNFGFFTIVIFPI